MTRAEKIEALNAKKAANNLPENVAKHYDAPHGAKVFHLQQPVKRTVDLRKISAADAKELAENEAFPFLVRKENGPNEPKK